MSATNDPWSANYNPLGIGLPGDWADSAKMQNPAVLTDPSLPWWEDLLKYGVTKVIDNRYGSVPQVQGNTDPGSFAGANGGTYAQDYAQRGTSTAASAANAQPVAGMNMGVVLLLGAGVLLLAMGGLD